MTKRDWKKDAFFFAYKIHRNVKKGVKENDKS